VVNYPRQNADDTEVSRRHGGNAEAAAVSDFFHKRLRERIWVRWQLACCSMLSFSTWTATVYPTGNTPLGQKYFLGVATHIDFCQELIFNHTE
jgi:hypothetical protein